MRRAASNHFIPDKGRVERLFGTLQDRLVSELRLAKVCTLADAQRVFTRFLPRFNKRFAHPPAQPEPAWRAAPPHLERICCFKYHRTVQHDNTIRIRGHVLQLAPGPEKCSYTGARVDVHVRLDDGLAVYYRGALLRTHRLSETQAQAVDHIFKRPRPPLPPVTPVPLPRVPIPPPADHPWRRPFSAGLRRASR